MIKIKKSELPKRRSIRLKNYDYSSAGLYFITICTWNHLQLLGKIENDCMVISKYGEIARKEWGRTGELRDNIRLHEFIIMPNHIHGIIEIINNRDADRRGTASLDLELVTERRCARFASPQSNAIPTIIRSYKSAVTKHIREYSNNKNLKIWQSNYYEHIIRNEESYLKISEYIMNNPARWQEDKYFG